MLQPTVSYELELKRYYSTQTIEPSSVKIHQSREKKGTYYLPLKG